MGGSTINLVFKGGFYSQNAGVSYFTILAKFSYEGGPPPPWIRHCIVGLLVCVCIYSARCRILMWLFDICGLRVLGPFRNRSLQADTGQINIDTTVCVHRIVTLKFSALLHQNQCPHTYLIQT